MSNAPQTSNSPSSSPKPLVEQLSPIFTDNLRWRDRLARRFAHRAVDIPDDMQIDARKTVRGVGTGGLIGAVLAGSLPALALAGVMLWQQIKQQPPPPVVEKQVWRGKLRVGWGEDGELDVDVLDKDGKPSR